MKGLLIVYDQELQNELDFILRSNNVTHFSRCDGIFGRGDSGLKTGDAIGPGLNRAYWIVLENLLSEKLLKELKAFKTQKLKHKGIEVFVLPVEDAF